MTIQDFKNKLKENPKTIDFSETMSVIRTNYKFTPTSFVNGNTKSNSEQNLGSYKVFAFALDLNLTKKNIIVFWTVLF
jgi:hypothetical protein